MEKTKNKLLDMILTTYDKYISLPEEITTKKLSEDKWTLKEIIGHLIDSASNNHQRFVRLQIEDNLNFPLYHYSWIEIEKYNLMKFSDILLLWKQYNLLLHHIIDTVDTKSLHNIWNLPDKNISLKELIIDYVQHLNDHIKHFESRLTEVRK